MLIFSAINNALRSKQGGKMIITYKERVLKEIIDRMISRYRSQHSGNLDDGMFRLWEKAKRAFRAENIEELQDIILDLKQ